MTFKRKLRLTYFYEGYKLSLQSEAWEMGASDCSFIPQSSSEKKRGWENGDTERTSCNTRGRAGERAE